MRRGFRRRYKMMWEVRRYGGAIRRLRRAADFTIPVFVLPIIQYSDTPTLQAHRSCFRWICFALPIISSFCYSMASAPSVRSTSSIV
jgi:hypothetical protein